MEFIIIIFLLMVVILIAPLLLKRFYVPSAIAILLFGAVMGPYGLDIVGMLARNLSGSPDGVNTTLDYLSNIGLIFLMSLAGMEISPMILHRNILKIGKFSAFSMAIPALVGLIIAFVFQLDSKMLLLFLAVFVSHSVAMVFSSSKELHFSGTRFGVILIGSTLLVEVVGLVILAIAVRVSAGPAGADIEGFPTIFDLVSRYGPFDLIDNIGIFIAIYIVVFGIFVIGTVKLMEKLSHMVFQRVAFHDIKRVTFVLLALFGIVLVGEFLGIHLIVSSFIGGLAIADSFAMKEDQRILHKKLDALGYGLFVPLFFFILGLKTDLTILFHDSEHLPFIIATVLGFIGAKTLAGTLGMRSLGFPWKKSFLGGWFTIPQLSTALAAALVGQQMGIFPQYMFSTLVILTVVTCIPSPIFGKFLIRRWHIHFHDLEADLADLIYSIEPPLETIGETTPTYRANDKDEYRELAPYSLDSDEEDHLEPTRQNFLVEEDGVDMILHDELVWDDTGSDDNMEEIPEEGGKTRLHKYNPLRKRKHYL